jgi:hypothetical protein
MAKKPSAPTTTAQTSGTPATTITATTILTTMMTPTLLKTAIKEKESQVQEVTRGDALQIIDCSAQPNGGEALQNKTYITVVVTLGKELNQLK